MNIYCRKSKVQYARESMREYCSRRRMYEISQIIRNEDDATNLSYMRDQAATEDTNELRTAVINHPTSSLGSEMLNELETSSGTASDSDMDIEAESDNDDIEEYLNVFDVNDQIKLFSSSPVSIRDACLVILKLARRLNLNKNGVKHLLNDIRCLFPPDAILPRSVKAPPSKIYFRPGKSK